MTARVSEEAPTWVRYGGIAIIVASILELLTTLAIGLVFPEALEPGTRSAAIVADVVVTYLILGVIGVAALYVRYGNAFGWIGTLGLASIAVGAVVGLASVVLTGSVAGNLLNLILVFGGALLLAVGLWRIQSVPRSAAVLMGAAPLAAAAGIAGFVASPRGFVGPAMFVVVNLTWGAAWIILGYHLWNGGPSIAGERAEPARL